MVLDKNPNKVKMKEIFTNSINSVLCHNAFVKEEIIQRIIEEYQSSSIIYLDFDLLYSGYTQSGIMKNYKNVIVYSPTKENWNSLLKEIIVRISKKNCILIIDSLNGVFTIFNEKDSGRYVNSYMMLLSSLIKNQKRKIFLTSIARLKEKKRWILYPTGRHVLENKSISKFFVNNTNQIEMLSPENKTEKIIEIKDR